MRPVKRGFDVDTFTPQTENATTWLPFAVYVEKGHAKTCILIGDSREGAEGGLWRPVMADDLDEMARNSSEVWRDGIGRNGHETFRWVRFVCACAPRYCDATVLVRMTDISNFIQQVAGINEQKK